MLSDLDCNGFFVQKLKTHAVYIACHCTTVSQTDTSLVTSHNYIWKTLTKKTVVNHTSIRSSSTGFNTKVHTQVETKEEHDKSYHLLLGFLLQSCTKKDIGNECIATIQIQNIQLNTSWVIIPVITFEIATKH